VSLHDWAKNGWLKIHKTSPQEIRQLFEMVARDIDDAQKENLSADWRFGIAYNAALKLCTILLYASGFRPEKNLAHYRTLMALPLILGVEREDDANYLDVCRTKRNIVEYDYINGVTTSDAEELIGFAQALREDVLEYVAKYHATFLKDLSGL
jgi:hypothetical protein